jgi:hypothetical protein
MLNIDGTSQCNRTDAGDEAKAHCKKMKVRTYVCCFFQHTILPLVVALWADNNNVTTLSNYHSPAVCIKGNGVLQKRKVNKGNGNGTLYDPKGSSLL